MAALALAGSVALATTTTQAAAESAAEPAARVVSQKTITIQRTSPKETTSGEEVTFTGTAPDSLVGKRVSLERRTAGSKDWVRTGRARVSAEGTFEVAGRASGMGRNVWHVVSKTVENTRQISNASKSKVFAWLYLADLPRVDSVRFTSGQATIAGKNFSKSVMNSSNFWWDHEPWGEWNLSYKCKTFQATIGLDDGSSSGSAVAFVSSVDDNETSHGTIGNGASAAVEIDIASMFRIHLEDRYVSGPTGSGPPEILGVWGDAKILCSAVPST